MSGFAKSFLQDFLATVSFEACSVLGHFFFFLKMFSVQKPLTCCRRKKKRVYNAVYIQPSLPTLDLQSLPSFNMLPHFVSFWLNTGGVRTGIAKHPGRYSKSDHLCQDVACSAGIFWVGETLFVFVKLL